MPLSELTSRDAVVAAIAEFDSLGRGNFLEKYGFRPARSFFLSHQGRRYDSKAIAGAAYGYQFPDRGPMKADEFSGGEDTVRPVLERIGFDIISEGTSVTGAEDREASVQTALESFLGSYSEIRSSTPFGRNEQLQDLMGRLRAGLSNLSAVTSRPHVRVSWSVGQGNWAKVPWIALMDERETDSTQRGIYVVFLFPEDMSGVYLTLNQGTTEIVNRLGRPRGYAQLKQVAQSTRMKLPDLAGSGFMMDDNIDLKTAATRGQSYEASTIAYKWYGRTEVPADQLLNVDLEAILRAYETVLAAKEAEQPSNAYWIFQANPSIFDVAGAAANLEEIVWTVSNRARQVTTGDKVFLWQSGPQAGVVAVATVISDSAEIEASQAETRYFRNPEAFAGPRLRVRLRIDRSVLPPLLRSRLVVDPDLQSLTILTAPQGGAFSVQKRDADHLLQLLDSEQNAPTTERRAWLYSPGENAEHWDEFYENNLMAIGWDGLGDLRRYGSVDDIVDALQQNNPGDRVPSNDANACYDFATTMKPGDIVYVKRGRRTVIGYGTVESEYQHEPQRTHYRNTRTVRWEGRGEWQVPTRLAMKTLTDITDNPVLATLKSLVGNTNVDVRQPVPTDVREPYTIDDALADVFMSPDDFRRALRIWRAKKNLILQGAPGVGKSYLAKRLAYALMGFRDPSRLRTVQFHQSYSYEDFVQGYRPDEGGGFLLKPGVFLEFCEAALADRNQTYVFIIDEINRGNLSKIFGELMLLIESDKRTSDWATKLSYARSAEERFYVPGNVYLIGMMNTADRSLSMVDYALRRRFAFFSMHPQFHADRFKDRLRAMGVSEALTSKIVTRMGALNDQISNDTANLGPGFCIGHSYFTATGDGLAPDDEWSRQVIETEIGPLLEEYWFDSPDKAAASIKRLLAE